MKAATALIDEIAAAAPGKIKLTIERTKTFVQLADFFVSANSYLQFEAVQIDHIIGFSVS